MNIQFSIKYRYHYISVSNELDDTKEETIIHSDGKIIARRYDHHGPSGHYRIIEKAAAHADPEEIKQLFSDLMDIIHSHNDYSPMIMDADAEIVLEEAGLKISADAFLSKGEKSCDMLLSTFLKQVPLTWQSTILKK